MGSRRARIDFGTRLLGLIRSVSQCRSCEFFPLSSSLSPLFIFFAASGSFSLLQLLEREEEELLKLEALNQTDSFSLLSSSVSSVSKESNAGRMPSSLPRLVLLGSFSRTMEVRRPSHRNS